MPLNSDKTLAWNNASYYWYANDFFITGDEASSTHGIEDVAEKLDTIFQPSRVLAANKYVETGMVCILLSSFSEAMQTDDGEDISSREVKMIMKEK